MNVFSELFSSFGFTILVGVVLGMLLIVSAADFFLTLARWPTVGEYVNLAVATRQWIAVTVALVFGAMIAHFFIYITHL